MQKRLLIITRQAGAVEAFAPVVKHLRHIQWDCDIIAFDKSKIIWEHLNIHPFSEEFENDREIADYNLLLTDTSEEVAETAFFWDIAKKNNILSIAYVDSWVNYAERFTVRRKFDKTPDYIGLIDHLMYQRMEKSGAPVEKLVVLGYSRFETVLHRYMEFFQSAPLKKSPQIIFFTNVTGPQIPNTDGGYHTKEVVEFVLQEFLKRKSSFPEINMIIKPHPRENADDYTNLIQSYQLQDFVMVSDEDPYKLMSRADAVFGLNTILLVDSSELGIPTYSFQPERNVKKNDITDRKNINVQTTWKDIKKTISTMTFDKLPQKHPILEERKNTKKFVDFINGISDAL